MPIHSFVTEPIRYRCVWRNGITHNQQPCHLTHGRGETTISVSVGAGKPVSAACTRSCYTKPQRLQMSFGVAYRTGTPECNRHNRASIHTGIHTSIDAAHHESAVPTGICCKQHSTVSSTHSHGVGGPLSPPPPTYPAAQCIALQEPDPISGATRYPCTGTSSSLHRPPFIIRRAFNRHQQQMHQSVTSICCA